jgi:hypothetical protein
MTVALDIVTDAATTAGVIDPRDSLADADAQFILRRLNRMIGSWANERLLNFDHYIDGVQLLPGQNKYTTLDLGSPSRTPVQYDIAYVSYGGIDYPVELVSQRAAKMLPQKLTPGIPTMLYVARHSPDTWFWVYPTPFAPMQLNLGLQSPLALGLDLTSAVDLPPGYEAALVDNLAVDISPSYGLQPSPQLSETARHELMVLKRTNHGVPFEMDSGVPLLTRRTFNIFAG